MDGEMSVANRPEAGEDIQLLVTLLDGNGTPYEVQILNSFLFEGKQYVSAIPVIPVSGNFDIYLFLAQTTEKEDGSVDVEISTIPDDTYTAVAEYYENNILPLDSGKIPEITE